MKTAKMVVILVLALGLTAEVANADFTFGTPSDLDAIVQSSSEEGGPNISADGISLFLFSNRPGGFGDYDLYVATRATKDDLWGQPVNLGPKINSSAAETEPSISANGLSLYFADGMWFRSSPRPGGLG